MTITQAMTAAEGLTGQVFPQEALLRWLSELDGQLAFEVYGVDSWTAYSEEDLGSLLLVPYPWDGLYVHKLEAMTYFSNGEYDRYANAQRMYEEALGEFKRFVQRTRARCGEVTITQGGDGGSAVTAIVRGCDVWRYISAYGLAVLHGYEGTPEEWLESLKGEPGQDGSVSFDDLTPEQKAEIKGDPGPQGPKGDTGDPAIVIDAGAWEPYDEPQHSVSMTAEQVAAIVAAVEGDMPIFLHWRDGSVTNKHYWTYVQTATTLSGNARLYGTPVKLGGRTLTIIARTNAAASKCTFSWEYAMDIWVGTQAEYDQLTRKSYGTYYQIEEHPAGLEITREPDTTVYRLAYDPTLDLTGMVVSLVWTDGTTQPLASGQFTTQPEEGTPFTSTGEIAVDVTYHDPEYGTEFDTTLFVYVNS